MKSIEDFKHKLSNKVVLVRLDLNVPIKNGNIVDTNRIDKIIPTLKYLLKNNSKLILISHVGRPNGKAIDSLSLKPIGENLSKQLNEKVKLLNENIYNLNKTNIFKNEKEKVVLLENIRFYIEEENNDESFAKHIASFGDIYVNEAFSCSHRSHASVAKISNFIESFAGKLLKSEIDALNKITYKINKPITCIIGGSKVSTKIKIIKNLIPKFNNIIIVGGMGNTMLKHTGSNIGKSICENECGPLIKEILENSKKYNCKITIPKDAIVSTDLNGKGKEKKNK